MKFPVLGNSSGIEEVKDWNILALESPKYKKF